MTYYILLEGDSKQSIWDENILGEESFLKGIKFYLEKFL